MSPRSLDSFRPRSKRRYSNGSLLCSGPFLASILFQSNQNSLIIIRFIFLCNRHFYFNLMNPTHPIHPVYKSTDSSFHYPVFLLPFPSPPPNSFISGVIPVDIDQNDGSMPSNTLTRPNQISIKSALTRKIQPNKNKNNS